MTFRFDGALLGLALLAGPLQGPARADGEAPAATPEAAAPAAPQAPAAPPAPAGANAPAAQVPPPASARPERLRLRLQANPEEVTCWLYAPPASDAARSSALLPVLFYAGEWGWTQLHEQTGRELAKAGRYILGFDTPAYFMKGAEGPALSADFETLRRTLNAKAGRTPDAPVLLAGFSYGAEMIVYTLNRAGTRGVQGTLLMAPDREGAKVFRASVQLKMKSPENEQFDVADEIRRLAPIPVVFLDGSDDDRAQGREFFKLVKGPRKYVPIPGADHQFRTMRATYIEQVANSLQWLDMQATGARPAEPAGVPQ